MLHTHVCIRFDLIDFFFPFYSQRSRFYVRLCLWTRMKRLMLRFESHGLFKLGKNRIYRNDVADNFNECAHLRLENSNVKR